MSSKSAEAMLSSGNREERRIRGGAHHAFFTIWSSLPHPLYGCLKLTKKIDKDQKAKIFLVELKTSNAEGRQRNVNAGRCNGNGSSNLEGRIFKQLNVET